MKRAFIITLAFLLAACGVVQQAPQVEPTPIVQTVVVMITPTAEPPTAIPSATEVPATNTPLPTDTPTLAPTNTAEPTATVEQQQVVNNAPTATTGPSSGLTPVFVDNILGKGVFTNITFSTDKITLNCFPREMQISMTANLPEITRVEMYYRVIDAPSALYPSDWKLVGNLGTDNKGNYSITFDALDIDPNYRGYDQAWLDFQFIGVNKGGGTVDRTQKIERLVTYYKECP
ncbi:MAG TPA: hypothetical protein PK078_08265 [Anaerolineales bacterium]|nr:hypothetical protein [Anaerolineales bacterium]HNA89609.1 hypothetical protein [Anaerolineales bacterium]HNB36733.1 hypothetical protein [Anaerolineales bacterium]HNC08145.1 hypothetical protein [Anaerolineales bacterium]